MKYIKPEIKITKFETEDIIQTSGEAPKSVIDGNAAENYGAQNFSIFDVK